MRSLLSSCVLLAPLAAQSPDPMASVTLSSPMLVPIHTATADPVGGGGGVMAAGADYKVRFADAVEFVPYLGAGYPHNQPFGWHTQAITVGGAPLPLHRDGGGRRSASTYGYDRGVAEERYEVRLEGLEQTFTFAARPGDGELRIRGALTTALRAATGDHGHADVVFADAHGTPIVGYGACTAIDADGHRLPMRTVVGDGWLDLVLPADAMAAAAWPVVVDPLLSNVLLSTTGTPPLGQPVATDVARDDENNQLMVTLQRHASATDEDTFCRLFGDAFTPSLGLVFADIDTTWDSTEPKVTFVGGADRWITVFTREFSTGTKAVRYHPHAAASTTLDTAVGFLPIVAGSSDLHPDVGGYAGFAAGVHAVVCWQRDRNLGAGGTHTSDDLSRVWFLRIDLSAAGTGTIGAATEIIGSDPSGAADRERPRINRLSRGTSASDFLIAYQTYWNAAPGGVDDWDVEGRRIDGAGNFLPGVWISSSNFPNDDHKLGPIVDGIDDEYVIAYALADNTIIPFKTGGIEGSRIACESYDFVAPAIGAPQVLDDTGFVKSLVVTGLSYDTLTRSHAVVVHHDVLLERLWVQKLGYLNLPVETWLAYDAGNPVMGGGAAHDDDFDRHVLVFGVEDGVQQPVLGRVCTYEASPAPLVYGNAGCQQGTIAWSGYHRLGHEHGALTLSGGPPSATAAAVISLAPANGPLAPFGFGNCVLLVDPLSPNYIATVAVPTSPSGYAALAIPVPETLPPFTAYFQWLVFTSPSFATTKASAGLEVVFDR
ncbi:MAG: hypothetical protein JNM25_05525 [Planctomycetes bacterium]|nr:hypothetical protein [Planctomycetota bacterium]